MSFKDVWLCIMANFFTIVGGSTISAAIFCGIFVPQFEFTYTFLWQLGVFAAAGLLPTFIFLSKKELTKKQMLIRVIINFIAIIAVLLLLAYIFEWVGNALQMAVLAVLIAIVRLIVSGIDLLNDRRVSDALNTRLAEINSEKK